MARAAPRQPFVVGVVGSVAVGKSTMAYELAGLLSSDGHELRAEVAREISPIAKPREIHVVPELPKTRSGKIMRRLLKARELGLPEGDISTVETPGATS